ncbi:MAG: hypothetical protein F4Z60_02365 [Chloroflexi bacterium]|nr:hypothetical protein [Chloroflexota bacterium]
MPRLVTALTTAPLERPNSASNWPLMTWNSCTDSIAILTWLPRAPPLLEPLFEPPSKFSELAAAVWPLAMIVSAPCEADGRNWIPGSSEIAANALRFCSGISVSSPLSRVPPTSAEVRSTSGACPETVTVSSRAPTPRMMSSGTVAPTRSS